MADQLIGELSVLYSRGTDVFEKLKAELGEGDDTTKGAAKTLEAIQRISSALNRIARPPYQ